MNLEEVFKDLPINWGRWGSDDEVGAVNHLDSDAVLRGIASVKTGKVFTLGLPLNAPDGDLIHPVRERIAHFMTHDKSYYISGKDEPSGGWEYADDMVIMYLQGSTQADALGHVWYGDKLYNGYPSTTTIGGLERNSMFHVAEHGVVGRGVLVDIPRFMGVDYLPDGYGVTLEDLKATLDVQQVQIQSSDILYVRTGYYKKFLDGGQTNYIGEELNEPGLAFSPELVHWFWENQIPVLASDTMGDEQSFSQFTGSFSPLHPALITRLGMTLTEMNWLEPLATDCERDGQYTFLNVISPLKIHGAAGSPLNPIAVK